jgi:ADP-ribose diphosphatase
MKAIVNHQKKVHQGRVFDMVTENITLPNGVQIDLDLIHHPGASAMVPMPDENTVILIKQYRHAVGDFIWEIPAGTLDPGEAPQDCAKRELIEEIGFSANSWRKLGQITPVPGYSDERTHIFLATDLTPAQQSLDQDEVLNVHSMTFEKALAMIFSGEIQDSKTINGLLLAKHEIK